jgi:non-homologous end joining protein Ku
MKGDSSALADIPELTPVPELLRLAEHILDGKLRAFDPSGFRDRYEEALMAHLKAKQAGMPPQPKQSWAVPRRTINLMGGAAAQSCCGQESRGTAPTGASPQKGVSLVTLLWRYRREQIMAPAHGGAPPATTFTRTA